MTRSSEAHELVESLVKRSSSFMAVKCVDEVLMRKMMLREIRSSSPGMVANVPPPFDL